MGREWVCAVLSCPRAPHAKRPRPLSIRRVHMCLACVWSRVWVVRSEQGHADLSKLLLFGLFLKTEEVRHVSTQSQQFRHQRFTARGEAEERLPSQHEALRAERTPASSCLAPMQRPL